MRWSSKKEKKLVRLKKAGIRYNYLGVLGKGDICQEERKKTLGKNTIRG